MRARVMRLAALVAMSTLVALTLGAGITSAGEGKGHADATFTKWITDWPNMAGVVGGKVGEGAFAGEVLDYSPGTVTVITANYHINGSKHAFTALMHVEQTGLHAVLLGVVTDGWRQGHLVRGEYDQISCTHAGMTTDCFQGTLDIK